MDGEFLALGTDVEGDDLRAKFSINIISIQSSSK